MSKKEIYFIYKKGKSKQIPLEQIPDGSSIIPKDSLQHALDTGCDEPIYLYSKGSNSVSNIKPKDSTDVNQLRKMIEDLNI